MQVDPDLRNLLYQGWDPHLYRSFGTFLEPVIFGTVLGLGIIYSYLSKVQYLKPIQTGLLALSIIPFLLTYARSVYAATVLTLISYFSRARLGVAIGVITFLALAIFFLPKPSGEGVKLTRTSTITARLADYDEGVRLWKTSPLFGVGYNRVQFLKETKTSTMGVNRGQSSFQSSFLTMLVGGGIIGLLLSILSLKELLNLSYVGKYQLLFASVVSLFDNVLLHPFVLLILLTSIALSHSDR